MVEMCELHCEVYQHNGVRVLIKEYYNIHLSSNVTG